MPIVRISQKGQILIPKRIREKYNVKPGGAVLLLESADGIFVKPAPEDPIDAACGFLKGDFSLREDLISEHRREHAHEKSRSR